MYTKAPMKHLVIIDTSVIAHRVSHALPERLVGQERLGAIKAQMAWLLSGLWLDKRPDGIICVRDTKPYWRTEYLKRPEVLAGMVGHKKAKKRQQLAEAIEAGQQDKVTKLAAELAIAYKGGRSEPSPVFQRDKQAIYNILDERTVNLVVPGYEADDLAAALTVLDGGQNLITLATVDSDWMGLVSEQVRWYCTTGYSPRLRHSPASIDQWALKRLGTRLDSPADIWAVKADQGDKSDNLPGGSPMEVISLLGPPEEHKLWLSHAEYLETALSYPGSLVDEATANRACGHLRRLGMVPCVRPWDPERD